MTLADRAEFTVPGDPAPKGSRIVGRRKNGSTFTRPASKREKPWCEAVTAAALQTGVRIPPPYAIRIWFAFARPARSAHPWPSRIDVDKATRNAVDGLVNSGMILDDRHVIDVRASKEYADISATRFIVQSLRVSPDVQDEQGLLPGSAPSPA